MRSDAWDDWICNFGSSIWLYRLFLLLYLECVIKLAVNVPIDVWFLVDFNLNSFMIFDLAVGNVAQVVIHTLHMQELGMVDFYKMLCVLVCRLRCTVRNLVSREPLRSPTNNI